MRTLGVTEAARDELLRLLAAVLHLGDISFAPTEPDEAGSAAALVAEERTCAPRRHPRAAAAAHCAAVAALRAAAELLRLPPPALAAAVTRRVVVAGRRASVATVHLSAAQAACARDALAKAVYTALFRWLVCTVNAAAPTHGAGAAGRHNFIGLLDIFGFEVLQVRSALLALVASPGAGSCG